MTVTFIPTQGPITHHTVDCLCCGATHDETFATRDRALAFLVAVRAGTAFVAGCTREPYYCAEGASVTAHDSAGEAPSVNVSNLNARDIIEALGVSDGDLSGTSPASAFLGRVLLALALAPESAGIPAHAVVPPFAQAQLGAASSGGVQMIECGRPEGYVQGILERLHEVAEFALAHDRDVVWS